MSKIEYLDKIERQMQQARAQITIAKNELVKAIDELNELQMDLNQERVRLLRQKYVETKK